jgi:hypothetical protein
VLLMNVEVYTVGALGQLPSAPVLGIGIVNSVLGWFWLRPSYNNMRRTKRTLVEVEERYHVHITPRRMTFIDFWASGGLLLGAILSGPIFTWIFNLGR